jgi:integrase
MFRPSSVPSYRRHKQSGQAIVTLTDGLGGRRDVLLGKYGTRESRAEYARVIAEWEASGRRLLGPAVVADLTINELALGYWRHAEQHYRHPDGTPTNELNDTRLSLQPLKRLYGHTVTKDFGPLALKAIRQAMVEGSWLTEAEKEKRLKKGHKIRFSRGVVNQRIGRIRRMFKWAVENELVPSDVLHGLQAVRGLQRGRSAARETEPVKPVPETHVNATLPFLRPPVAAMVRLQLLTGMRPGEVVIMRAIDIDMTGKVWLYRPGSDRGPAGTHKTAWRGQKRIVPIGPRGQEIIRQYLKPDLYAYLFSPQEAVALLRAEQRRNRKTNVQPSQVNRRKRNPQRRPRGRYTTGSYAYAIKRACLKADSKARREGSPPIPHWHPHQLRHTKATEIRREAGLDAARAVLGHRSPQMTELYAELDMSRAAAVMERLG